MKIAKPSVAICTEKPPNSFGRMVVVHMCVRPQRNLAQRTTPCLALPEQDKLFFGDASLSFPFIPCMPFTTLLTPRAPRKEWPTTSTYPL